MNLTHVITSDFVIIIYRRAYVRGL